MRRVVVSKHTRQLSPGRLFGGGRRGGLLAAAVLAALALSGQAAAKPGGITAGASIIAQAHARSVPVYRSFKAKKPFLVLSNPTRDGGRLVFLVVARYPGWEQVRLAVRPNGTTGWIKDSAVDLVLDPYSVQVSLHDHRLIARKGSQVLFSTRAGVGRSVLPTPTGQYYIVELLRQSDPSGPYGPFAFGLSAFSNVLYSFGGGPGQIGLHGTDDPGALGTDVSHGCIRVSNSVISRLAGILPLGTPVEITP
jgi:lipoprotein-anchoring transpeptidase ErfK/SrfK